MIPASVVIVVDRWLALQIERAVEASFCDAESDAGDCEHCDGTGRCECDCGNEHDCHECDGTGDADANDIDEKPELHGWRELGEVLRKIKRPGISELRLTYDEALVVERLGIISAPLVVVPRAAERRMEAA